MIYPLLAGITAVLSLQFTRQIFPNIFIYLWHKKLCQLVPTRYRELTCFTDKDSLLFVGEKESSFVIYRLTTPANLQNIVLYFGLTFMLFHLIPINDIKAIWNVMGHLLFICFLLTTVVAHMINMARNKSNPDIIIWGTFNILSLIIAMNFGLMIFSALAPITP